MGSNPKSTASPQEQRDRNNRETANSPNPLKSSALSTGSSPQKSPLKWIKAPILSDHESKESRYSSTTSIPGGSRYDDPRKKAIERKERSSSSIMSGSTMRTTEDKAMGPQRQIVGRYEPNSGIKMIRNTSENGGKKDVYFGNDAMGNDAQAKWVNFVVEEGLGEEEEVNEQFAWLKESEKLQFDPDDPKGLRLPPGHLGRAQGEREWTEKEMYFGRRFKSERMEFDHFNKSLILDSCPPFPDRMVHHEPLDGKAPLYLGHITQSAPMWSLRKKTAKTYGPSYLSQITMPPMKLPDEQTFAAMLNQFRAEKEFKKYGVERVRRAENVSSSELLSFLERERLNEGVKVNEEGDGDGDGDSERVKMLGVGTPYFGKEQDAMPREYEIWDKALCYELRHDGDPRIPTKFKEDVFRQFVDSIDRNGSMAPWQKNYAFSLLPAAFGGVEGQFIDVILSKMAPKAQTVPYRLREYPLKHREQRNADHDHGDGDKEEGSTTERTARIKRKRVSPRTAHVDGLGL